MNTINAHDLKKRLEANDCPLLVNAMEENKFRALHIPGSMNLFRKEDIEKKLNKDDTIIVYCTDQTCNKSILLYQLLEVMGYKNISRFAGGLREWEDAGYPLEGEMVK
jgi:rhodanese-related sulfurtransferase